MPTKPLYHCPPRQDRGRKQDKVLWVEIKDAGLWGRVLGEAPRAWCEPCSVAERGHATSALLTTNTKHSSAGLLRGRPAPSPPGQTKPLVVLTQDPSQRTVAGNRLRRTNHLLNRCSFQHTQAMGPHLGEGCGSALSVIETTLKLDAPFPVPPPSAQAFRHRVG